MKRLLISVCCAGMLAACSDSASNSSAAQTSSNPTPVPLQEDLSPGLRGQDADANGIRDDIDKLIAGKYSQTPALKQAAEQKARALQAMMEATTKEEAFAAANELSRSTSCIYQHLGGMENQQLRLALQKELEALTANTRERLVKYLESNKLVGGGYFTQPVEPVCD